MSKGGKNNKNRNQHVDAAAIEERVRLIEAAAKTAAAQLKTGMTKAQRQALNEKIQSVQQAAVQSSRQPHIPTPEEMQAAYRAHSEREAEQRAAWLESQSINHEVPLPQKYQEWAEVAPNRYVRFQQFDKSNERMQDIVALYEAELSEPYSSFTYQFFVFGWADLCLLAYGVESSTGAPDASVAGEFIGAVVSRISRKAPHQPLRGYIAMLAVKPSFRGARIGSRLVEATVDLMRIKGGDEVGLETPTSNARALKLYTDLGFAKTKFLPSYYLDGSDAYRLKLYLYDFTKRRVDHAATVAALQQRLAAANPSEDSASPPPALEATA